MGRSRAAWHKVRHPFEDVEVKVILTSTEGTVPDELGSNTERTGDTEENGVEVHLVETVVGQEDTRVSIDVGPGVLGLSSLQRLSAFM